LIILLRSSSTTNTFLIKFLICGLFVVSWRALLLSIWWKAVVLRRLLTLPTLAVRVVPKQWAEMFARSCLLSAYLWLWCGFDDALEWALRVMPTVSTVACCAADAMLLLPPNYWVERCIHRTEFSNFHSV
jgi:hypothetical protein